MSRVVEVEVTVKATVPVAPGDDPAAVRQAAWDAYEQQPWLSLPPDATQEWKVEVA